MSDQASMTVGSDGPAGVSSSTKMWRTLRRNRTTLVGATLTILIVLVALLAPVTSPYDPVVQDIPGRLSAPSSTHVFGTDFFGRDILSRVMWGTRISLLVGVSSVAIGLIIGSLLGMLAALRGGRLETVIMRLVDVLMSFPDEVLGIMIIIALGSGLTNLIVAISLLMVPRFTRLAYGPTLAVKQREYLTASVSLGARDLRLMLRHILPNIAGEILVMSTLWTGTAIRLEANLSFLGLGVAPPTATWGNMIRDGLNYLTTAWWMSVIPGVAILLTVLAFNLIGDGIRDVSDPKLAT